MATLPYVVNNPGKNIGFMKMFTRMGAYPLDASSVFNSRAELEAYINEAGSYRPCPGGIKGAGRVQGASKRPGAGLRYRGGH